MSRKWMNTSLILILALALIFVSTSCEKLSYGKLRANYHFSKANNHFRDSHFRDAIEEYELALQYNPDLLDAYRFLGESYKSLYKPAVETERNKEVEQKALEALNKAYEVSPTNKAVIYSLGDMYDKIRDFEKAEALYLKILEMEPTNMGNYYVVAEFYKRYAGGEEEDKEADQSVKTPFEKAEEMYLRRIETDPDNEQGYAYIAQFYEGITPIPEFDLANEFHERRISINPESAEAWLAKGVNRWSKAYRIPTLPKSERINLAKDSETALLKASELDPTYPEPYSWLSVLYKSVLTKLSPERAKRYEEDADRYLEKFQEARKRQAERKKLEEELGKIG
ncbi:MAG: tetratricopeptide repeat protein [Candidatus Aminicenantes bacterium]|nr:tetratricopeptide repeat protein [Candidatus Aminicenantes bacterium]